MSHPRSPADSPDMPAGRAMATSPDRVHAAGGIVGYPGEVRLTSVGSGKAATAVNNAVAVLDPKESLFPGHSSDLRTPA